MSSCGAFRRSERKLRRPTALAVCYSYLSTVNRLVQSYLMERSDDQCTTADTEYHQSQRHPEKATIEVCEDYVNQDLSDRTSAQNWSLTKRCLVAAVISLYTSVWPRYPCCYEFCHPVLVLTAWIGSLSTLHQPSTSSACLKSCKSLTSENKKCYWDFHSTSLLVRHPPRVSACRLLIHSRRFGPHGLVTDQRTPLDRSKAGVQSDLRGVLMF